MAPMDLRFKLPHQVGLLPLSRREFLLRYAGGIGGLALASLLAEEGLLGGESGPEKPPHIPRGERRFDLRAKPPHFPARARAVISLFMHGGPSHVDLMDPKPELSQRSGEDYQG